MVLVALPQCTFPPESFVHTLSASLSCRSLNLQKREIAGIGPKSIDLIKEYLETGGMELLVRV